MPSAIFYWVLNMSITASIMGIIILLIGKIRRIPRFIICLLWCIPFLRMWVPISVNSKFSLMALLSKFATKTVIIYDGTVNFSMMNSVQSADRYFPMSYKVNVLDQVFSVATTIWLIIAIALLIAMIALYMTTKHELKDSRHLRDNIYVSDKITSPATYGIIYPRIILPKNYNSNDLKYILMHEQAHIKRLDNLWRIVAIVTACIHWFNPLSWLFLKVFLENLELACDEKVLKNFSEEDKKRYALTLINCTESKSLYASAFGGARVKVRIERILSYKKLSLFAVVTFLVFASVIAYILLTNAS